MILVRDRSAEQGEDPVAGALHDVPVVAASGVDHQLERGIDDRPRLFGIEILLELGRSLDVGEQCGNRLALSLDIFGINSLTYADTGSVCLLCYRSRPS